MFAAAAALLGKDTDEGLQDRFHEFEREIESLTFGAYRGAVRNTQTMLAMSHDDAKGRLFLEDNRLRMFDTEGNLLAVWSNADFGGIPDLTVLDDGTVYLADYFNDRVLKLNDAADDSPGVRRLQDGAHRVGALPPRELAAAGLRLGSELFA